MPGAKKIICRAVRFFFLIGGLKIGFKMNGEGKAVSLDHSSYKSRSFKCGVLMLLQWLFFSATAGFILFSGGWRLLKLL